MGVTRLETGKAVFIFDHELHGRPFKKSGVEKVDYYVLEHSVKHDNDDPYNITGAVRPFSLNKPNYRDAVRHAQDEGRDILLTDMPLSPEYAGVLSRHDTMIYKYAMPGMTAMAVGTVGAVKANRAKMKKTRRGFLGLLAAGSATFAYGITPWVKAKAGNRQELESYEADPERREKADRWFKDWVQDKYGRDPEVEAMPGRELASLAAVHLSNREGEIPIDDPLRVALVKYGRMAAIPRMDLRDIHNAAKLEAIADANHVEGEPKKVYYLVFGAMHTGILDYLEHPESMPREMAKYPGDQGKYLQTEWTGRAAHHYMDETGKWRVKVLDATNKRMTRPSLIEPGPIPENDIANDAGRIISRREMLRKLGGR